MSKKQFVRIGNLMEGKKGNTYLKLNSYKQDLRVAVSDKAYIDVRDPAEGAPDFVQAELYVKVGSINKSEKGGTYLKLTEGVDMLLDGDLMNKTSLGIGAPNDNAPEYVLNDVFTDVE